MEQAKNTILKQSLANWFIISLSNSWGRLIVHYPLDQLDTVIFLNINWVDQCLVSSPLCCWKLLPSDITSVNCFQTMCNCHSTELTSLTSNEELGWQVLKPNCPEQLAPQKGWQILWEFHSSLTVNLIGVWVSKCWTLRDVQEFLQTAGAVNDPPHLWITSTSTRPLLQRVNENGKPCLSLLRSIGPWISWSHGQKLWMFIIGISAPAVVQRSVLPLFHTFPDFALAHEPRLRFQLRGTQSMLRRFPRNGFVQFDRQHGQIWGALS